jgi:hypothetical protein
MWRIRWAPNNASKWQMRFNFAFKGLNANTCNLFSCTFIVLRSAICFGLSSSGWFLWEQGYNIIKIRSTLLN